MSGEPPSTVEQAGAEPLFAEPWEAQVFGLVVGLREAGLFTGDEWARALGAAIRPPGAPERTADYREWLTALEGILAERGLVEGPALTARAAAFERAAAATSHGQPILLENDPLAHPPGDP